AGAPVLLPGFLYSVNPIALRQDLRYLAANRRSRSILETREFGRVVTLEVGATNVGSWEYTFQPGSAVAKGQEKGYFRFGGSLTITLFGRGRVRLAGDLVRESAQQRELYARVGEAMGTRA
ncbi:MAG: phosphatidylserine decarboxylase, partial [Verrucomicrobiota bacterium]